MNKLISKKKRYNNKKKTKKLRYYSLLNGGNKMQLNLSNLYLPGPSNLKLNRNDNLLRVAYNTLRTYNIKVNENDIQKHFTIFIKLVREAVKKINKNPTKDFSNDSNKLLNYFNQNYDYSEIAYLYIALKKLLNIVDSYNSLSSNKEKRKFLDEVYESNMKIHSQFDKEEAELDYIYNEIQIRKKEERQYNRQLKQQEIANLSGGFKSQIGGLATFMKVFSKVGIAMGALPVVMQIMTHNFHINIIEFITGNELMSKLKKILNKVMKRTQLEILKDKEETAKQEKFLPTEGEILKSTIQREEKETRMEINKGILKEQSTNNSAGGGKSDYLSEFIENLEGMKHRFEAHLYLNSFFTGYYLNMDEDKRIWEPYTQMLRDSDKIKELLKTNQNAGANNEDDFDKYSQILKQDFERINIEINIELFKKKKIIIQTDEDEFINVSEDGEIIDENLARLKERYNDIQSTREQEVKEKQMDKYYETLKPIMDLIGTLYDVIRPGIIKQTKQIIEDKGGKMSGLDEEGMEYLEPMNPFDLTSSIMSLTSGKYPDFAMELIPVLMASSPHLMPQFKKLMGKKKR